MCYEQKQGRKNEWGVIIPSASPKTDCLKATGALQPLCLNLRGVITALTNVELSNVCIRMAEGPFGCIISVGRRECHHKMKTFPIPPTSFYLLAHLPASTLTSDWDFSGE